MSIAHLSRVIGLVTLASSIAPVVHAQGGAERMFGTAIAVGADAELVGPMGYDWFRDGSFVLVEYGRTEVTRLTPDGRVIWRVGRKGGGPGEYQVPYRAMVLKDESVLVIDLGRQTATHLSSRGEYLGTLTPDMRITWESTVVLPSGDIAVSGVTSDPRGAKHSVHIFSDRLIHKRSFGPLPELKDPRTLRMFGAGGLTRTVDGDLVHTRYYPYEIRRYSAEGIERSRVGMNVRVAAPEEYVQVEQVGTQFTQRINGQVPRPIPARLLSNGQFFGGRVMAGRYTFDLIDAQGRIVRSTDAPTNWSSLMEIDHARRHFWFVGEKDDVPVLLRVPFGTDMPRSH